MIATMANNYPKIPNPPKKASLRLAISKLDRGDIDMKELKKVEDDATCEAIDEQIEAGLDLVTDGQIRWDDGQTYLAKGLSGFKAGGLTRYFDTNTYYRRPEVEALPRWHSPITVRDFEFAQKHSPKPVKAILTGPYSLAKLSSIPTTIPFERVVMALAEALNLEAKALQQAGAKFIQFDEPAILRNKADFPLFSEAMVQLTEKVETTTILHPYFGNLEGVYHQITGLPFSILGVDLAIEKSNWKLLEVHPPQVGLCAGIVDARNTKLENVDWLKGQILKLCRISNAEKLQLSTNYGLEFLPRENAFEKLKILSWATAEAKKEEDK